MDPALRRGDPWPFEPLSFFLHTSFHLFPRWCEASSLHALVGFPPSVSTPVPGCPLCSSHGMDGSRLLFHAPSAPFHRSMPTREMGPAPRSTAPVARSSGGAVAKHEQSTSKARAKHAIVTPSDEAKDAARHPLGSVRKQVWDAHQVLVDSDPEGVNQAGRAIMEGWDPEACLVEVLETVSQQEVAWRIAKAAQMASEAVLEGKEPPPLVYIKSCDVHGGLAHVEIRYGSRKQRANYVQVWSVLTVLASLCVKEETCTLRGLYYRAKASFPRSARTYEGVSAAVQVVVGLLQVPRPCLGVVAASKGEFFGNLHVRANDAGTGNGGSSSGDDGWIDCRNCVVPIPGDVRQVEAWHLQTDAQLVLVVEKEAVLHRLYRERIHQKVPVIVLTAKGMPDLASRSFLRKLHVEAALPVAAVVDWNPSGVIILHTYAQGGLHRTTMLEASRYSIPELLWLGVRREHIQTEELECFGQPLTAKDRNLVGSMLRSGCLDSRPGWKKEVMAMQSTGRKVDIEALIDGGGDTALADLLALHIMQESFA